ncbi:MAG: response regulator, partial [Desulfuromonas sp.]
MSKELLVIDDERCVLELCQIILANKGYTVRTAGSGAEGLRLIAKLRPALVLLDYMMP